jgi:hypothetical protein
MKDFFVLNVLREAQMSQTLDEWVEKNAADLKSEIDCHVKVMTEGDQWFSEEDHAALVRLIFISIRQWREQNSSPHNYVHKKMFDQVSGDLKIVKEKLALLRRYHGGDGSITREQVIETLYKDSRIE